MAALICAIDPLTFPRPSDVHLTLLDYPSGACSGLQDFSQGMGVGEGGGVGGSTMAGVKSAQWRH